MQKVEKLTEKSIENFTPAVSITAPSGPVICSINQGKPTTEKCKCPPNTRIQSGFIFNSPAYWCIPSDN